MDQTATPPPPQPTTSAILPTPAPAVTTSVWAKILAGLGLLNGLLLALVSIMAWSARRDPNASAPEGGWGAAILSLAFAFDLVIAIVIGLLAIRQAFRLVGLRQRSKEDSVWMILLLIVCISLLIPFFPFVLVSWPAAILLATLGYKAGRRS